ncbi:hypothetical protein EVJ58_g6212 [Rhodofomes roseus]|uniref:Protein kinase domain-containing protein n=1 Tax=Rhodofomes roseus TaxID=34475 RepID=A0A4Y9Y8U0_9APHY|nr:hypothetical protein EVJ58_g6212 [Rhodofomes roseus]
MPRGRVNMPPSHYLLRSSHLHPNHLPPADCDLDIDVDIDIDIAEQPQQKRPMPDKSTPRRPQPQQYHSDMAHAKQNNPEDVAAWHDVMLERIKEYPDQDVKQYLARMVPSDTPMPACPPTGSLFDAIPVDGPEKDMYNPLVDALGQLATSFPPNSRPQFYNYGHNIMHFPFAPYADEQHPTKPDVVASFPVAKIEEPISRWKDVALVFELKPRDNYDPMVRNTPTGWDTLMQLAKNARNMMLSQGRLYAFVVGIYGTLARIFRFDRAGGICSPKFEYKCQPEILHEFLWRLFHPRPPQCEIAGADPTAKLGTGADKMLVRALARDHDPRWAGMSGTRKVVRRIVMTDRGRDTTYLTYKLVFVNPGLFSRATLVWQAFKLNEEDQHKGKTYIVKETWRQMGRVCELEFYEALRQATGGEPLFGVATYIHGEDLGERDEEERNREAGAKQRSRSRVPRDMKMGHRTIAGVHSAPKKARLNERSHTRIVLETVGTPLAEFESTRELVLALRDAVEGHRQAYEAGLVHRDISEGNVMIAPKGARFRGYIQDFDFSFCWKWFLQKRKEKVDLATWEEYCVQHGHEPRSKKDPVNESKERTGTIFFMAIEILSTEITHEARHDLESFYWLLIFIVLRHTNHGHHEKDGAFGSLFCVKYPDQAIREKTGWMLSPKPPLTVPGNEPLTRLLEKFRLACTHNFPRLDVGVRRMTHGDILAIFDDVLAPGNVWPEDDAALEWKLPENAAYTTEVKESRNKPVTKGSFDPTTGSKSWFPGAPNSEENEASDHVQSGAGYAGADARNLPIAGPSRPTREVEVRNRSAAVDAEVDEPENQEAAFWEGRHPSPPPPMSQPEAGPSEPPARKATRKQSRKAGKSAARRAEAPPETKRPATRRAAPSRPVAETWPASVVEPDNARPGRRYNLRSSGSRNMAGPSTSDGAQSVPVAEGRMTRSRTQLSLQQDAGTRDSSVGKRGRAQEDLDGGVEESLESQSSKRQRTLSQPRGRKTTRKSAKKP